MQPIKKAVIPAAGLGTRFLPVTKAIPKELLPIVDVPTLQVIIDEAAQSGIEEILLIVSTRKDAIKAHFSPDPELEDFLRAKGKTTLLARTADIAAGVRLHYVLQEEALGLGHAVSLARDFAAGEAIAVLLGDDVVASQPPALSQLTRVYEATGASVLGVQPVAACDISKYGIVAPAGTDDAALCLVQSLVEKPAAEDAPSNLAIMGRYIITPAIFDILAQTAPGKGGEIQLTDALNTLSAKEPVYACQFTGTRYDVGDQLGFLKANIEFGLKRPDTAERLKAYLIDLVQHLS